MTFRAFLAALALTLAGLVVPAAALTAPADAAVHHRTHHHKGHHHKARHHAKARHTAHRTTSTSRHACTTTASGSCIRGGQFCPSASKNHSGWDASNRRYVCRGGSHPHWEIP